MRIYEARLSFNLLRNGPAEPLSSPEAVAAYMEGAFEDPTVEWFFVILLNRKNMPLGRFTVSKGTANSTLVHPREVFKPAILAGASAVVVVHNHPSGDPAPSTADIQITRRLREAGRTVDLELLDHVIIGDPGLYSFNEAGLL